MKRSDSDKQIVVIGDGWCALGAVSFCLAAGMRVDWVPGMNTRIEPPLAYLEAGPGVRVWLNLIQKFKISCGELEYGSYLREFRNQAFRKPLWMQTESASVSAEQLMKELWAPERRWLGLLDAHWNQMTLGEIENSLREKLQDHHFSSLLRRINGLPLLKIKVSETDRLSVFLGSGEELKCDQFIYADRWSQFQSLDGIPSAFRLLKSKKDPQGVLQAHFNHKISLCEGVLESFIIPLAQGDRKLDRQVKRHVFGYFSMDGRQSTWTLCLPPDEAEDNHLITKKFRRLKNTLDRVFSGSAFIPTGYANFGATIEKEQIRFQEEAVFSMGQMPTESFFQTDSRVLWMTDGYGPSAALCQVGMAFGIEFPDEEQSHHDECRTYSQNPPSFLDPKSLCLDCNSL